MKIMKKIINTINNKNTKSGFSSVSYTFNSKIKRSGFSTVGFLYTDKGKSNYNGNLDYLYDEKSALKQDLGSIHSAVRAASKISTGETPSQEESESLSHIKDNYPAYFDSEGEQEGASSELNRVMGVKRYLREEYKTNKESIKRVMQEQASSDIGGSSKRKAEDNEEPSTSKKIHQSPVQESSTSKEVQSPVQESSTSKEVQSPVQESPLSFVEQLGDLYYNPFDDVGFD